MIDQITKLFEKIFSNRCSDSREIPEHVVNKFISNPDFPWLISFPRTGSHWLRMLMELYFKKPSLMRAFYISDANDFTCYHHHDQDLSVQCRNVIYLYRNPVDTIYSQLNYYKEETNNIERIRFWTGLYARHLSKWLFDEKFTNKKSIITYEGLKNNLGSDFEKICTHLNTPFDSKKIAWVAEQVTKEKLKKKTSHDDQVVNLSSTYEKSRTVFKRQKSPIVFDILFKTDPRLKSIF